MTPTASAAALALFVAAVGAQPATLEGVDRLAELLAEREDARARAARLASEANAALKRRDLDAATALLLEHIELEPDNFVPRYNLACVFSVQRRLEASAQMLGRAVELGFISKEQLERDPWLANVRATAFYRDLIEHWPAVLEARRDAQVAVVRTWLAGPVERSVADDLRLDVLSSHDPVSTAMAVDDLRRVAAWAEGVAPDLFSPLEDDPWTVVVLPERRDFTKWAVAAFGPRARGTASRIGGAYEHHHRRLVSQDLGATLRHEFMHVLHWRAMDRLGQTHPIWIQEGLASLVEDLDPAPGRPGELRPAPSRRTNVVKRLARAGRLPELEQLAGLSQERFSTRRPLAQYAQARTLFLYLDHRDALGLWLGTYVGDPDRGFDADPSGLAAFDAVIAAPRAEAWRDYRTWVAADLQEAPDAPSDVRARLGVAIEEGDGDGPRVRSLPRGARARTGLRIGDVITAIDGRPTRDFAELLRILAGYTPGDTVAVSYRRGRLHKTSDIGLVRGP